MSAVCRTLVDTGTGYCSVHKKTVSGFVETGAPNLITGGGSNIVQSGDIFVASCGHTGVLEATATKTVGPSTLGIVRIGDPFTGIVTGTMTTGSPLITCGG